MTFRKPALALLLGCLSLPAWLVAEAPPKSPLTPAQAKEEMRLLPGLEMERVASEPQIESPVAMAFDEEGRLWVVEMRDYPNGPKPGKPGTSRIKILEDKDGDGHYETSSVFADHLLFANGLLPWNGGVIVTAAPHILFLKDTDGDGKAEPPVRVEPQVKDGLLQLERSQILYEGFATENPQLRVSHPKLGLDGWIYVANGLRGGQVKRVGVKGAKAVNISGSDFRMDLLHDRHEAITGLGQFGNCFDDWNHRFVCDNRHHLRYIVLENRYLRRNPFLAVPSAVEDISILDGGPLNSGGKIYPISRNWTTSNLHAGRFTAACGVHVHRGDHLPKSTRGNVFTCDPTGNLVHREILSPSGGSYSARPAREKVEFLASRDEWFRPVFLSEGPDGALYLVDMYRAVIEHPQFMPQELKNRPDLLKGREKGRIWRIVAKGAKRRAAKVSLGSASLEELVTSLSHENAWHRETAQRLLLQKYDPESIPLLRKACEAESAHARATALWLLERLDGLTEERLVHALEDKHPRVREQAARLAESRLGSSESLRAKVMALSEDPDGRVRFQAALSLGGLRDGNILKPLTEIAARGIEDPWTRRAVLTALPEHVDELLSAHLKRPEMSPEFVEEIAEVLGAQNNLDAIGDALGAVEQSGSSELGLTFLRGLTVGMRRRGLSLARIKDKEIRARIDKHLAWAASVATDEQAGEGERSRAIELLAHADWEQVGDKLLSLLTESKSQSLRLAAIEALSRHGKPEVGKAMLESWRSYTPTLRRAVTGAMLARKDRILLLLEEMKADRVKSGDLDVTQARRLLRHKDADIRQRAAALLKDSLPADRQKVLKEYQAVLKLDGEAMRGRDLFEKNCATCHRVGDIGIDVGPDISDTRTKTPAGLLLDILNPNQAIDNNYVSYQVETVRGKVYTGIIVTETDSSITLKEAENKTHVLLRRDIDRIRSNGVSLMPEGLEKNLNHQQMADLISYLKNWRYLRRGSLRSP